MAPQVIPEWMLLSEMSEQDRAIYQENARILAAIQDRRDQKWRRR